MDKKSVICSLEAEIARVGKRMKRGGDDMYDVQLAALEGRTDAINYALHIVRQLNTI
jgi:hypothetical protein